MKNIHYIFDFDNTLVYTDKLNNESYNYALKIKGYNPINSYSRVTRNVISEVYPQITHEEIASLINLKQDYYVKNIHKSECNLYLINYLRELDSNRCMLWTSANFNRVLPTLSYYNIHNCFGRKFYSSKTNIKNDLIKICMLLNCNVQDLVVYEDNKRIITELALNGVSVIQI